MNKIVGIGANVCDTLVSVPHYPKEDTKLRAYNTTTAGGGPCATGLVAASKLGESVAYIGALTDDNAGKFLMEDLKRYNVSTDYVSLCPGHTSFSSYILLSDETSSRTCVFHKGDIPPYVLTEDAKRAIIDADVLMIDGNEMSAAIEGAKIARQNGTKVLYDAGGLYEGIENLLPYADILIPSEEFSLAHSGKSDVYEAAKWLYETYSPDVVVITRGKDGGIIYDGNIINDYPAFKVEAVDSNGSGDVFHGAFAFCMARCYDYYKACLFSSAVSALKCTKVGARSAVPSYDDVIEFLKERGLNV